MALVFLESFRQDSCLPRTVSQYRIEETWRNKDCHKKGCPTTLGTLPNAHFS